MAKAPSRLKRVGIEARAYEVFEWEFNDEEDRRQFIADPLGYTTRLYEAEGIPVNHLHMEVGGARLEEANRVRQFHCVAPPEDKSGIITIVD